MKYPKVYYQMQAMLAVLRKRAHEIQDKAYLNVLIGELEAACEVIECAHMADNETFTGGMEDLADLDVSVTDRERAAEDVDDEDYLALAA